MDWIVPPSLGSVRSCVFSVLCLHGWPAASTVTGRATKSHTAGQKYTKVLQDFIRFQILGPRRCWRVECLSVLSIIEVGRVANEHAGETRSGAFVVLVLVRKPPQSSRAR
ncbi:unnamed protein product [Ectocarpus fasciculatus]